MLFCGKQRLVTAVLGKTDNASHRARGRFSRKFSFKIYNVKSNICLKNSREKCVQKLSKVTCTQYYSKEYEKFYFRRTSEGKKELHS